MWFNEWFNEDYAKLYAYHDEQEAVAHVDFLVKALALKKSDRILDMGCGNGRHSLVLASRGFSVVGIDVSDFLIGRAKKEVQRGWDVDFQKIDLLLFEPKAPFDIVLNLFTSFGYYDADSDNQKILSAMAKVLRPGGTLFLDTIHPSQVERTLVSHKEREVEGVQVLIDKEIVGSQVIKTITFPHRTYTEKVKLYNRDQIEKMLMSADFLVSKVLNDYEGTPWRQEGDRQLFVATRG